MNEEIPYYDCAIVGGGPAGLSLAAWLGKKGFRVILFEKNTYPFHKVCGEYLSLESMESLRELGMPLESWELPRINTLFVSSPDGTAFTRPLQPGGVGLSRYRLDQALAAGAKASGARVLEQAKVDAVFREDEIFKLESSRGGVRAGVCCASFGRHANLDVKWKREGQKTPANFIGVKYHVRLERPRDTIELHYFKGGYCGISPVEEGKYCVCYLTTEKNLREQGNDIFRLEERVLSENPFLRKALKEAIRLYKRPLTVSHVGFSRKSLVEDHVLMLGDAAGMIAPLCGNGMSMALHSSKLAADLIAQHLEGNISRDFMEKAYQNSWQSHFANRMRSGRLIQGLFLRPAAANVMVKALRPFPTVIDYMIRQTHGQQPF